MEFFDISQTLQQGMASWPGDPDFYRHQALSVSKGQPANVCAIRMGTHTGTHIDAPLHLTNSGLDAAGIPVHKCLGPARVVDLTGKRRIRTEDLASLEWGGLERVLFQTRSSHISEQVFIQDFAYLDPEASSFLAQKGILLVGIDSPSVDPYESIELPAHRILLERNIIILENIRLGGVKPGEYNLSCIPLKIAGADGSPVRAVLWR